MADKQAEVGDRGDVRQGGEQVGQRAQQVGRGAPTEQERGIQRREGQGSALERGGGRPFGGSSPFGMMRRMMEDMDRLFDELTFGRGSHPAALAPFGGGRLLGESGFMPAIEVFERDGKLVVRADLPGIKKDEVRVNVDENGLVIEGERQRESEEEREGYFHSERSYGSFQRRIALPRGVDLSTCDATFDDGVLEVKLALPKESGRRSIEVRSGASSKVAGKAQSSGGVRH